LSLHLNWIALEGGDPSTVLEELGLQEVGAAPEPFHDPYAYTVMPTGRLILFSRGMKFKFPQVLPKLSAGRPVLAAEVSDIVMYSSLEAWRAGGRLWAVRHDPEKGAEHLEIDGEAPADLAEIASRLLASQAADDGQVDHVFDAPLELGERLCGYRPDGASQPGPWIQLAPEAKTPAGPTRSALPAAIRAELLPALGERGWSLEGVRLANDHVYDASRVRNGRLEALRFLWRDDRRDLAVFPRIAIVGGATADGPVLAGGSAQPDGPTLMERLKARFGPRPKTCAQKVEAAIAATQAELAHYDALFDAVAASEVAGDDD
jgi:hypothetical protein